MNNVHVVPHEEGWAVKEEGGAAPESVHSTQKEATDEAAEMVAGTEANVVVHKANGVFKRTISPGEKEEFETAGGETVSVDRRTNSESGNEMSENRGGLHIDGTAVSPSDTLPVFSRVSWSAITAAVVVAFANYFALSVFGIAVGLTAAGADLFGGEGLAIGGVIWQAVTMVVSLFLGGYVASRCTTGETPAEALIYGVLVWGVMLIAVTQAATLSLPFVDSDPADAVVSAAEAAGMTGDQVGTVEDAASEAASFSESMSASAAAWWAFGSMLVGLFAACFGAAAGAGPRMMLVFQGTN